jgi:hypothetical protein
MKNATVGVSGMQRQREVHLLKFCVSDGVPAFAGMTPLRGEGNVGAGRHRAEHGGDAMYVAGLPPD